MAEYYPLLARAIAGLPQSTPEARRGIYDRARAALIGQLRAVQPPIAPEDIDRESRMLDEAIDQLEREAEAAPPDLAPVEIKSAPPFQAPPVQAPDARSPGIAAARRPEGLSEPPPLTASQNTQFTSTPAASPPAVTPPAVTPPASAPLTSHPAAPMRPAVPPRPAIPPRPAMPSRAGAPSLSSSLGSGRGGLGALEAARQRLAGLARPSSQRLGMPAPITPPMAPPMPPATASATPAPLPVSLPHSVTESRDQEAAAAQPFDTLSVTQPGGAVETPEARLEGMLRKYGPRAEAAGTSADSASELAAESSDASPVTLKPEDEDGAAQRGIRPAAPQPPEEKNRNFRALLIGLPVVAVVGTIAVLAYLNRESPEDLGRLRPAPGAEAPAEPGAGKIVERIGGGQATRPGTAPATSPSQQSQAPASGTQAIPVSQRAALLVDAPDDPQRVRTFIGNVVWRLDNVSRGPGQPLAIGVRAEIELPDARLRAVMLIQKNIDDTLPASHTIEFRFTPAEGGPIPGISQISTPQMRKEDSPAGDALGGVPAPIMRNFFLIGLTRGDAATARNVDLIRTRGWFDVPMLMSDQRIAKITFEKGAAGERIINEAFEAWKQ